MNHTLTELDRLILHVLTASPTGLRHVEIVRRVLAMGYKHPAPRGTLSADVYDAVKCLVSAGSVQRHHDDVTLERTYSLAGQ